MTKDWMRKQGCKMYTEQDVDLWRGAGHSRRPELKAMVRRYGRRTAKMEMKKMLDNGAQV